MVARSGCAFTVDVFDKIVGSVAVPRSLRCILSLHMCVASMFSFPMKVKSYLRCFARKREFVSLTLSLKFSLYVIPDIKTSFTP